MAIHRRRRGFALIELPLVLFILAFIGLAFVVAIRLLAGPVAWYWWPVGLIALPAAFFAYAMTFGVGDEFGHHQNRDPN